MAPNPCQCCSDLHLPQFGFGSEIEFRRLAERNPFLFRVHTPAPEKPHTPLDDAFVAPKFQQERIGMEAPPAATYAEVLRHFEQDASVYVATSFSFMWAIWEALRRHQLDGGKHDIEIAVIDATASLIAPRAITAVEVLSSVSPSLRHPDHWKWYHQAQESQCVLVYGAIPQFAVLSSIPLLKILESLPSYCLHPHPTPSPFERVAWTYPQKPSFYRFCAEQAAVFQALTPDAQTADATIGATCLAMTLLGEWAAWMVQLLAIPDVENKIARFGLQNAEARDMFSRAALTKVLELAQAIARWPSEQRDHEVWRVRVREMGVLVSEEISRLQKSAGNGASDLVDESFKAVVVRVDELLLRVDVDAKEKEVEYDPLSPDWHQVSTPRPTEIALPPSCPMTPIRRPYSLLPTPPPTPPPSLASRSASTAFFLESTSPTDDHVLSHVPGLRTPTQASASQKHGDALGLDLTALEKYIEAEAEVCDDELEVPVTVTATAPRRPAPLTPPESPLLTPTRPGSAQPSPSADPLDLSSDAEPRSESGSHSPQQEQEPKSFIWTVPDADADADSKNGGVSANPRPHSPPVYIYVRGSLGETASYLFTGFFFGVLLVSALVDREPARLYAS
uniref:DUF7587 domain-containing protein n=1 Tax=Mycena chlorophos TaxID=658473 RepID=A0ABQ0L9E1_MYCCL|nr:predicted protein [Mycena chlorophos]